MDKQSWIYFLCLVILILVGTMAYYNELLFGVLLGGGLTMATTAFVLSSARNVQYHDNRQIHIHDGQSGQKLLRGRD